MAKVTYIILLLSSILLFGCEEDLTLNIPAGEEQIIVEGHIEQGFSPFVVLTKTQPLFTDFTNQAIEEAFVRDAEVVVVHNGKEFLLSEFDASMLSNSQKEILKLQFGIPESLLRTGSTYPFYVYTTDKLKGELGESYALKIRYKDQVLSSTTTIPQLNPLDSLWTEPHPDPKLDSLKILYYRYIDPDTIGNSVRYFTKRNQESYYPGLFGSVFNDELINGGVVIFPLDRGEARGQAELNRDLYGYFGRGDTVTVRWSAIDLAHFRFWNTLESEQNSNGSPIGSPNTTRSNIEGGLGVWGGYASTYHTIIID